ncbi:MAG TPA: DUF1990 family protein [Solirubrobacteraceae bacterium]|nr:DUF1990 family protein [Solirubrobacteraceae bacterium]
MNGPETQRRLAALADAPVNYDPRTLDLDAPPEGWHLDDRCQPLPSEPPGEPVPGGSWEIARRLIQGYEFADPSIVRAHYHPDAPLDGRTMLLELRALNLVSVHVGVRVVHVYDEVRRCDGRDARVSGWAYRTLRGHVEMGQMDWQVWKWLDTGEVQFRVHAVSRPARIGNPVIRIGFWLLRGHERAAFLGSTETRMRSLTEAALERGEFGDAVRDASPQLTARRLPADDPAHERLARHADGPVP